jgi:hypothetical protein
MEGAYPIVMGSMPSSLRCGWVATAGGCRMAVERPALPELTAPQIAELEEMLGNFITQVKETGELPIALGMRLSHGSHAQESLEEREAIQKKA